MINKVSIYVASVFLILVVVLLASAKGLPTKDDMIREQVEEKMAKYAGKEKEKCRQKVLDRAGELVDSTLIVRAKLQVKESLLKPEIPFRPDRPEVKIPKDTTPVVPIFPNGQVPADSTINDTTALKHVPPFLPKAKKEMLNDTATQIKKKKKWKDIKN